MLHRMGQASRRTRGKPRCELGIGVRVGCERREGALTTLIKTTIIRTADSTGCVKAVVGSRAVAGNSVERADLRSQLLVCKDVVETSCSY